MGTDYLKLFDQRTARLVMRGDEETLAAFVDSRTRLVEGPPVWRHYWVPNLGQFCDFQRDVTSLDRLKALVQSGATLQEIRSELVRELCEGDLLYLDYYGCEAEVFGGQSPPPGAITWEEFEAEVSDGVAKSTAVHQDETGEVLWEETSGAYLLTSDNTNAILRSLRAHADELRVMNEADVARLQGWHNFCLKHPDYCVLYQVDF